ncbi:MAG: sugar O-acyltransferase (sialic acid O-acetyltransferase NeuD family) [bacterium]|jgi:sugar O-acyltransferase (sialic acid O-acetyltransferase NeuD family)
MKSLKIIGYSGHSYVCIDSHLKNNGVVEGYFDDNKKKENPYGLDYFGSEGNDISNHDIFITIGDNIIRKKVYNEIKKNNNTHINIIDPSSVISLQADFSFQIYVGSNAIINSKSLIEEGCIINSGSIIEHQCILKSFSHIAPGATLCGNVSVGHNSFIGSNSVVLPNITIGNDVIVGAGSVITKNIPSNSIVFGNPGKIK